MNKICPKCNTSNPAEANFCRHCGYEFQSVRVIKDGEGGDLQTDEIEQIRQKQAIDWEEKEMQYKTKQDEMQKKIEELEYLHYFDTKKLFFNKVIILLPLVILCSFLLGYISHKYILSGSQPNTKNITPENDSIEGNNHNTDVIIPSYIKPDTEEQTFDDIDEDCHYKQDSVSIFNLDSEKSTPINLNRDDLAEPDLQLSAELEKYVLIEKGTLYNYGYVYGLDEDYTEQSVTNINLDSYYISKYDVIQCDYKKVMGENPSSQTNDSFPAMGMSFIDALKYCNKLSKSKGYDGFYSISGDSVLINIHGNGFRLPTKYEYAFAARDRKKNAYKYAAGNNLSEIAWHAGNSKKKVHKVGQKKCNELGLFDMVGNVYKYVWSDKQKRINVWYVGGSYRLYSYSLYTFREYYVVGDGRYDDVGIRLVYIPKDMQCGNIQANHWINVQQRKYHEVADY